MIDTEHAQSKYKTACRGAHPLQVPGPSNATDLTRKRMSVDSGIRSMFKNLNAFKSTRYIAM